MRATCATAAAVFALLPGGAFAAGSPTAKVVLPPGEGNTVTLSQFTANQGSGSCADLGPHTCDQLQTYEDWGFRDGALAPDPGDVPSPESDEQPEPGVRIVRDRSGVPHVYASGPDEQAIEDHVAFGIGYAQAQERLFQMEVLRRAAEGRLADLLGPDYLTMDEITRRDSETRAERAQALATELTPGERESLQAYADGINAVIAAVSSDPGAMPAGFSLTQDLPIARWTSDDTLAVLILETKNVAESAGNELGYAALAERLRAHYPARRVVGILDDVQLTGQKDTPTTVPHGARAKRTTDRLRYRFIHYSRADTARRIAALPPDVEAAHQEMLTGARALDSATRTLGLPVFGSNAWALAPSKTTTGGSILWGAPQVSYYVPEVLDELEIQGGPLHVHGVGVPGGGPGVVIGYTPHTAWSITTAQDDQVDTYVDRIRPAAGGAGYEYFWRGGWHPVDKRTETISVRTNAPELPLVGARAAPVYTQHTATFYRTTHGPPGAELPCLVVYLDPAAGVSYCKVRAFWNAELESGRAIVDANRATDVAGFGRAVREGVAGFNFVYADDRGNIAYWHSGRIPVRAAGHDPRLPAPGDGSFDWRGYLSPRRWPSVVDPRQGFVASWNNKPQASWPDSGDGSLWGAYQRVRQPMALLRARRRFSLDDAWQVARRTGELDLRATLGFRRLLLGLAPRRLTAVERGAVSQVKAWDGTAFAPGGVERDAAGNPTGKVAAPGFAIMEAWFKALERHVAAPVFGPVVDGADAAAGLRAFTQTPQTTSPEFEFYDDYDAFAYDVLTGRARQARYLGHAGRNGTIRAALDDAIAALSRTQGPDPAHWRADMPQIAFQALDVAEIPTIDWENRGTWGQAVALPAP